MVAEITRLQAAEQRLIQERAQLQQHAEESQRALAAAVAASASSRSASHGANATVASTRYGIKLPPPKEFKGTMGQEVTKWLYTIEHLFTVFASEYPAQPAAKRIQTAISFFAGNALSWWRGLSVEAKEGYDNSPWSEFAEALRDRFAPIAEAEQARARLLSLRQNNFNSLNAFVEKFLDELTPIQDEMHQNDQVHHFRSALKDQRIVQKLIEGKPESLTEAIKVATRWDAHFTSNGRLASGNANYFRNGASTSYTNRSSSHSSSGPVPMEVSAVQSEEHVENEHGDVAHAPMHASSSSSSPSVAELSKQVAALQSHIASLGNSGGNNRGNKFGQRRDNNRVPGLKPADVAERRRANVCFRCNKPGHWKNECPQTNGHQSLKD